MNKTREATGQCLCGAVKVTANTMSREYGACHCRMCRQWGGGPLMAAECGSDVVFEGETHIRVFNSSDWAERGFCSRCGTHLFYRLKEGQLYHMPVGIFSDMAGMTFTSQVFIDSKPDSYDFANDTRNLTGAQLFALFAPPEK